MAESKFNIGEKSVLEAGKAEIELETIIITPDDGDEDKKVEDAKVYVIDDTPETNEEKDSQHVIEGPDMPFLSYIFLAVEEFDTSGILSRKYYASPADPRLLKRHLPPYEMVKELNPDLYGFRAQNPTANVTLAEHIIGNNKSQFISTSTNIPDGAKGITGKNIYIDIQKLKQSGAVIISNEEIVESLIKHKTKYPHTTQQVNEMINITKYGEMEVTIKPKNGIIPPDTLITPSKLNIAFKVEKVGRVVTVFAIVMSAYDLGKAGLESLEQDSIKPISAEAIRQAGGWGGAIAGSAAGAKLLGTGGAFAGSFIPGAGTAVGGFIGGVLGGLFFGFLGYFGSDILADYIHEN